ncbi:MAG: NAD(P)-dependent oxidoreductase [Candidatus Roizmanbacteria bacterium]
MKITFFEVEDWETPLIKQLYPEAILSSEHLNSDTVKQFSDSEIVVTFIYSSVKQDVIDQMPNLKLIATRSTGFDHIDVAYAKTKNIPVVNVPEYGSRTVAEHTFALLLTLTRKVFMSISQMKECIFDHKALRGVDLYQKTFGLIGLGKIGKETLKIAKGFGMNVIVYNRSQDQELAKELGFTYVDLQQLVAQSDVVSLHLPYNKDTHHIVNAELINNFKKGSYLLNTARGGLIETDALLAGLESGILAGVGLDVLEEEKELGEEIQILNAHKDKNLDLRILCIDHVLMHHPRVVVTPHNAFNSIEALNRIMHTTLENIQSFIAGQTKNSVN